MSMSTPSGGRAGEPTPGQRTGAASAASSAPAEVTRVLAPPPGIIKRVTCPVCATTFDPRGTEGRCPVCGEQVMPAEQATPYLPLLSPTSQWLFRKGNWRVVAVLALAAYEIALFIALWIHLAQIHAL